MPPRSERNCLRSKLQYVCTDWETHYKKDKASVERVQRKAAQFLTENYKQTASVTGMLQGLEWNILLQIMRKSQAYCDVQNEPWPTRH